MLHKVRAAYDCPFYFIMKYEDLDMSQKALVMRAAVRSGIVSLNDIQKKFNILANGGLKDNLEKLFAPTYEGDFKEAFRTARQNRKSYFRWNGELYNSEITPNPMAEAARNWDTKGDPAREDFRMQVIRDPNGVLDFYNKKYSVAKGFKTANREINEYNLDKMYSLGTDGLDDLVIARNTNHNIGKEIWGELQNSKLSYDQKLAILANSYHETSGWTALKQYNNGPATGAFMMEPAQKAVYDKWLKNNNLKDSVANQTKFVVDLFTNDDSSLVTPWDRVPSDFQDKVLGFKDEAEAKKESAVARSVYNHKLYTTKGAKRDWNSGNLDNSVRAFEGLFERAGAPVIERRQRIAHILKKYYK